MWNDGFFLIWQHILYLYHQDQENGLKIIPIISGDHVRLNSYSQMRVDLAAQILSATMSTVLEQFGPQEASQTASFCRMMDHFFDCLNVRNLEEHTRKQKPYLAPYTDVNDNRFHFLENEFLVYFDNWKHSTINRPGEFTTNARAKMFISWQTHEGQKITVYSLIEAVKFLLQEGMEYVLSEKFCQDPCEEYFGVQRSLGRRCDNPDSQIFGYNDNAIRIQRHISSNTGNTRGRHRDNSTKWCDITDDKLERRKRK